MNGHVSEQIRNIALVGHQGAGKTSILEAIAFHLGKTTRKGDIASGNTISDYTEEEIARGISVHLAVVFIENKALKLNFIDSPGYSDFWGEAIASITASENLVFCVSADAIGDITSEAAWSEAEIQSKPVSIVLNKLDKDNLDFQNIYVSLSGQVGPKLAPLYVPFNTGAGFHEVIDLSNMRVVGKNTQSPGESAQALTDEQKRFADVYRDKLFEAVASSDETLMEKYLNGEAIPTEELKKYIKTAYEKREIFPLISVSTNNLAGIESLVEFLMTNAIPPKAESSEPFSGIVFKTSSEPGMGHLNFVKIYSGKLETGKDISNITHGKSERVGQISVNFGKKRQDLTTAAAGDIITLSKLKETRTNDILSANKHTPDVQPMKLPEPLYERSVVSKSKGDEEKIAQALSNILLEHPTVKHFYRTETREMVISGVGNIQLDVIASKIKSVYHVDVELRKPKVPYKETVMANSRVEGKYKRQSGGRGQYGHCWLKVEHKQFGTGFEFADKIVGGAIPKNYIPSIEKGVKEAMEQGVIAGYPVVDIKVTVDDGSFHEVDSSDMAFKIAGAMALRKGVLEAKPCILEPILNVEIVLPEEFMGAVMGDLNARRGRVLGMDRIASRQLIKAQVPWGEMFEYLIDLKSLTKGAGRYKYSLSHYEIAPPPVVQPLIELFNKSKTKEEE